MLRSCVWMLCYHWHTNSRVPTDALWQGDDSWGGTSPQHAAAVAQPSLLSSGQLYSHNTASRWTTNSLSWGNWSYIAYKYYIDLYFWKSCLNLLYQHLLPSSVHPSLRVSGLLQPFEILLRLLLSFANVVFLVCVFIQWSISRAAELWYNSKEFPDMRRFGTCWYFY